MPVMVTSSQSNVPLLPASGSRFLTDALPRFKMSEKSIAKDAAYQLIHDELMLDGNPRFDLCTFVTTWMEPEADKLMTEAMSKNFIAEPEYPVTTELEGRCVNMIARLFNSPIGDTEVAVGVGTVGSSEAILLAALAFKRKWQHKMKDLGKPYDKPNIVASSNIHVCWEKFANYFEVELRQIPVREGHYVMEPEEVVKKVDENTICVVAILGSTYNGEFEDVKLLNDLLLEKNKETGLDTGIHVDAASGGFVAPFLFPDLEWDFKLPLVRSINVSGHKYGLVYAGIAWVIWRTQEDLPNDLIFHVSYLGSDKATFTLNFSKGSSQVVAQYYNLVRLGHEGYKTLISNCMEIARAINNGLEKMGRFNIISNLDNGIPLVAFSLKDRRHYDEYSISDMLRRLGWMVPAYKMPLDAENVKILRVVIREDFSGTLVERLINDIKKTVGELDDIKDKVIKKLGLSEDVATQVQKEISHIWGYDVDDTRDKTKAVC